MSIPVRLNIYSTDEVLVKNIGLFTVSYGSDPNDIHLLSRRVEEGISAIRERYPNSKYIVALNVPDYMIDMDDTKAVLPNKFRGEK